MIPYDDLVAALSAWRARQGLPVSTMGAASSGPAPAPMAKAPSGPKTAPPQPPRQKGTTVPPPLAMPDTVEEVDDSAMLDEASYENEGDDFAMKFGGNHATHDSSTEIGAPPTRDSVTTDPVGTYSPPRGGKHKPEDEW